MRRYTIGSNDTQKGFFCITIQQNEILIKPKKYTYQCKCSNSIAVAITVAF